MNAFMYYMRRIDLLEEHAAGDCTNFVEYAVEELMEAIDKAVSKGYLTDYQHGLLIIKMENTVF